MPLTSIFTQGVSFNSQLSWMWILAEPTQARTARTVRESGKEGEGGLVDAGWEPNPQRLISGKTVISEMPPVAVYISSERRTTLSKCSSIFIPAGALLN